MQHEMRLLAIWQNQQPEDRALRDRVFDRIDEAAEIGVFAWSMSGGEPLMNANVPDYIEYASAKGLFTSMPTNGLALKKYAEACVKLDQLEVSIDTLDRDKFKKRRGIDGLPTIIAALDYIADNKLSHNLVQINAAVNDENLHDLPELAEFCTERGFLLHTEPVHNVVRTTYQTEDVEIENEALDRIEGYVLDLKKKYKCVRFYTDYFKFYRGGGFSKKFPCRSASHLINMRPDGSIQFPCAFVSFVPRSIGDELEGNLLDTGSDRNHQTVRRHVGLLRGMQNRLPVRSVSIPKQSVDGDFERTLEFLQLA